MVAYLCVYISAISARTGACQVVLHCHNNSTCILLVFILELTYIPSEYCSECSGESVRLLLTYACI